MDRMMGETDGYVLQVFIWEKIQPSRNLMFACVSCV